MSTRTEWELRRRQWAALNPWEIKQSSRALLLQEGVGKWNPKYVDRPMPAWLKVVVVLVFLSALVILFRLLKALVNRLSK